MSELPNGPETPSRLLELVHAYTQPRDEDDLAVAAPTAAPEPEPQPEPAASPDEPARTPEPRGRTRQPGKSRRRHGSSKARRKPRTNDRAAAPGPRDAEAA